MKRWIFAVLAVGTMAAIGFYVNRTKPASTVPETQMEQPTAEITQQRPSVTTAQSETKYPVAATTEREARQTPNVPANVSAAEPSLAAAGLLLNQAIETLVSPRTSYDEKQTVWKQLRKAGTLDNAIHELEQRVAANPQSAENVAALGQAYYKKAGDTQDVRESAILAMKADQTLEAALQLDPSNWDARFMRAVGMTYWPPELNKTKEMVEQFQLLIQQQESQTPQPQFAKSYLKLGEQYEKNGYPTYAAEIWQRGATFFPADADLKEKLTATK